MIKQVKDTAEFLELIKTSDKPVVADFYAEWCGPCKMMAPVFHEIGEENPNIFVKIDADSDEFSELVAKYNVTHIPTVIKFVDGKDEIRASGFKPKEEFLNTFKLN